MFTSRFYTFIFLVLSSGSIISMKRGHKELEEPAKIIKRDEQELTNSLLKAVQESDVDTVKMLIKQGADVNACNEEGKTLLMLAVEDNRKDIVELLLTARADPNRAFDGEEAEGITALMLAAKKQALYVVPLLLAHGAFINRQDSKGKAALHYAVEYDEDDDLDRDPQVVKILLKAGADANLTCTDKFDNGGVTPLMLVENRDCGGIDVAKLLIEYGASVNAQDSVGWTPLMHCVLDIDLMRVLVDKGAQVNTVARDGATVLSHAVAYIQMADVVEFLLNEGARVDIRDTFNNTPLLHAIRRAISLNDNAIKKVEVSVRWEKAVFDECRKVVRLLLEKGAYSNAQDRNGSSALMIVIRGFIENATAPYGNKELRYAMLKQCQHLLELLLDHGANVNLQDRNRNTALTLSLYYPYIVSLLLKHSAQLTFKNATGLTPLQAALRIGAPLETIALLELCQSPEGTLYRSQPYDYVLWHRTHCLERNNYIRNCEVNPSKCLLNLQLSSESTLHSKCTHNTVLMWACMLGHREAVEELLKAELPLWYLNAQDKYGKTALMHAIVYGYYGIVKLLAQAYEAKRGYILAMLDHEHDETQKEALMKEFEKIRRALGVKDKYGNSILTFAIAQGKAALVKRLLDAGARPTIQEIEKAAKIGFNDILIQLLLAVSCKSTGEPYPRI